MHPDRSKYVIPRSPVVAIHSMALLILSFFGCHVVDIEGQDRGVFFPGGRASYEFESSDVDAPHPSFGLEAEFVAGRGESSQFLEDIEAIHLDDVILFGPGEVSADFELVHGMIASFVRIPLGDAFLIDGLFGLGIQRLQIEIDKDGITDSEDILSPGPMIGARIAYEPASWLTFSAQSTVSVGFDDRYTTRFVANEMGARFNINETLGIRGGWRFWFYRANADDPVDDGTGGLVEVLSDIDLRMSGPALTLELAF